MGQTQTKFIYSQLEFVEYKKLKETTLESFLVATIQQQMSITINETWTSSIEKIAHKIRCISEGWDVMPKIQFELMPSGIPRVVKILDGV